MEVKDIIIPYRYSNPIFRLYTIGDIHCGTIHCVEDKVRAKVAEIEKDKNALWIGMGDYGEFITPSDPRFDPHQKSIAEWVDQDDVAESERKWIVELFKPIKKKCVGLLYGNHENAIRVHTHNNVHKHICEDLGVDNLGYSSFVIFHFHRENSNEKHNIKGVFTHGSGWAITKGAKLNKLRRFMDDFDALIYGYAHMHDIITDSKPYLTVENGRIKQKEAVGAVTGSWFRTYTKGIIASYGEQKVYPPTVIGCPHFILNAEEGSAEIGR